MKEISRILKRNEEKRLEFEEMWKRNNNPQTLIFIEMIMLHTETIQLINKIAIKLVKGDS